MVVSFQHHLSNGLEVAVLFVSYSSSLVKYLILLYYGSKGAPKLLGHFMGLAIC